MCTLYLPFALSDSDFLRDFGHNKTFENILFDFFPYIFFDNIFLVRNRSTHFFLAQT